MFTHFYLIVLVAGETTRPVSDIKSNLLPQADAVFRYDAVSGTNTASGEGTKKNEIVESSSPGVAMETCTRSVIDIPVQSSSAPNISSLANLSRRALHSSDPLVEKSDALCSNGRLASDFSDITNMFSEDDTDRQLDPLDVRLP